MENENYVAIAKKVSHKGQLHGLVSNGGGPIEISHGIYIKLVALNNNFTELQILHGGIDANLKTQSWVKSKVVEKKPKVTTKGLEVKDDVGSVNLFDLGDEE